MRIGEARISVSLATIEFKQDVAGTRLIFTEQGAFLDHFDKAEALAKKFEGELATA